jgi:hypothetical protein
MSFVTNVASNRLNIKYKEKTFTHNPTYWETKQTATLTWKPFCNFRHIKIRNNHAVGKFWYLLANFQLLSFTAIITCSTTYELSRNQHQH